MCCELGDKIYFLRIRQLMNVFLEQLDRSKPQLVPLVLMSNKMLCLARITRKDEFVEEKVHEGFSEE